MICSDACVDRLATGDHGWRARAKSRPTVARDRDWATRARTRVVHGRGFSAYAFKLCPSVVTLKPNGFPNRAGISRLFDRFEGLTANSEAGRASG